eukprot:SAG11_NODE_802_length_7105_cov_1.831573_5_plen_122_part_00
MTGVNVFCRRPVFLRIFCIHAAAQITSQGRQMLARTKEITETQCGLEVVYGDTDSIMVNTRMDDYDAAISKGKEVMKKINEPYKCVEIDIDYVFKNMRAFAVPKSRLQALQRTPFVLPTFR